MLSVVRTVAFVAACTIASTACSSDDGDDDGSGGSSNGGSGGGSGDCTETGCPDDETCTVCLGANGEPVNACIPEGVACY
jgi:hypothetical protein